MRSRMFTFAVLFIGVAGFAGFSKAADPSLEYKAYASTAGRYKILFPGPVKTETTDVKGGGATLKLTLDSVEVRDGVLFVVTYIDLPEEVSKEQVDKRLDKVRDGNKGSDGKVLSEKKAEVGIEKLPGREFVIEKPSLHIRNRAVIANKRLYQVMVQGSRDFVTSKEVDRFFDAFVVTK